MRNSVVLGVLVLGIMVLSQYTPPVAQASGVKYQDMVYTQSQDMVYTEERMGLAF